MNSPLPKGEGCRFCNQNPVSRPGARHSKPAKSHHPHPLLI